MDVIEHTTLTARLRFVAEWIQQTYLNSLRSI